MQPDALIFDMDGTLWDAVESYCKVWDATFAQMGIARPQMRRDELLGLMGKPLLEIFKAVYPEADGHQALSQLFMAALARNEEEMMPRLGGKLYPGVKSTLEELRSQGIKLFMVSNCSASGLDNFLDFTGLRPLMTDALSFGGTGSDKDVNLRHLKDCYNLKRPLYVGDIQRDCDSTHQAGLEFIWAAYGFGKVVDAEYKIDTFKDLKNLDYGK